MNDSLSTDESSSIIYNNLHFNSLNPRLLPLSISVEYPDDWRLLGQQNFELTLRQDEEQIIPLTFMKLPNTKAEWQPVRVKVARKYGFDTLQYEFYIKAQEIYKIHLRPATDDELFFDDATSSNRVGVVIRNQGNTEEEYNLTWKNEFLRIQETARLKLGPGKDTTCFYTVTIPSRELSFLKKELLECTVNGKENKRTIYFKLNTVSAYRKENASAYNVIKSSVSGGLLNYGNNNLTYYIAASANVSINDSDYVNFFYRSKQYGILNSYEKNIFNLTAKYRNILLTAGQMIDSRYFITYGNGIKIRYKTQAAEYTLWGTKHYNNYIQNNDNGGTSVKYKLKNFIIEHIAAANVDERAGVNSVIADNKIKLLDKKDIVLSINGGAGLDHYTHNVSSQPSEKWGSSLGYDLRYSVKSWNFSSNIQKNSDNYPGVYKGMYRQYHEIRKQIAGSFSAAVFYQYNSMKYNYFRDSLYNSDVFTYNMERYGLRGTWATKHHNLLLSTGILKQTGIVNTLPRYQFIELNYRYHTQKNFSFNIISLSGYSLNKEDNVNVAWITNSGLQANYKYFGLNALYVKTPMYSNGTTDINNKSAYNETVNFSPYITYSFAGRFSMLLNYSLSKLLNNDFITHYAGGSISYSGLRNGLSMTLNASIPLQSTQNDKYAGFYNMNYFNFTLTKNLNIPIILKKKYHTIRLTTFFDENNNGRKDPQEQFLKNNLVQVKSIPFKTNEQGEITYKNIMDGEYDIDLSRNNYKGMIPSAGITQNIDLSRDTNVVVAYKKSKTITGNVKVLLDTNSHLHFTAESIKLLLMNDGIIIGSTITDTNGNFYFNVPAGSYLVSLNPDAFGDALRPVQAAYSVDVTDLDNQDIQFTIKQKNRQVNMKNVKID